MAKALGTPAHIPKYGFEPNKPVKHTQEYSLYDEKNKLLLRTKNYDELRKFVEAL